MIVRGSLFDLVSPTLATVDQSMQRLWVSACGCVFPPFEQLWLANDLLSVAGCAADCNGRPCPFAREGKEDETGKTHPQYVAASPP
ncbi:hypothetical protein Pla52o_28240 [Novipirellula galeiformis]|uniref:Uncharacterized protein n=1 Tax=Novipirellula galeiformis TaxID=2528004 RepID=A0A5C6CG57_9BACT|nr:hypothetical protein Pla52o_28240 [Novipirellula galeiformis]